MSPGGYYNATTGEPSGGDDLSTEEPLAPEPDHGIGKPPAPKDAGPPAGPPPLTREQQGDRWEAMRARWLAEPGLADDAAFMAEYTALASGAQGHTAEEGQEILGTAHEGRLRPPEAEPAGTYEELPDKGVVADRPEQDAVLSVARNLEAEPVVRDFLYQAANIRASGPPPDDATLRQQIAAAWPTLAERQAIDARLDDLHAAIDRMLAEQGLKPAQRERWLSELTQIEDYGPPGIEYLLGPFTEDLWSRGPAAFANAHAAVQGEAYDAEQTRRAKAQQAEPDDPTREVGRFGRP